MAKIKSEKFDSLSNTQLTKLRKNLFDFLHDQVIKDEFPDFIKKYLQEEKENSDGSYVATGACRCLNIIQMIAAERFYKQYTDTNA